MILLKGAQTLQRWSADSFTSNAKWSVIEAPTYLKPASRVSDDVEGFRGHNNNLHLQCGSNNLDSLDSQNSGLTQCLHHVQELGVRVMPLGTSDSPVIQPDSGCIPHPKVRCFQIAAAFLSAKDWCGVDWHPTSNRSHHHFHAEDCVCYGEFMIKTEWVRNVGNICVLWEWHVSYGHGYRSRLGTPIVRSGWWFGTFFYFSISYMGCHPSHWRTPWFFKMVTLHHQAAATSRWLRLLVLNFSTHSNLWSHRAPSEDLQQGRVAHCHWPAIGWSDATNWKSSSWCTYQWIGLREHLQESPIFNGTIYGFL